MKRWEYLLINQKTRRSGPGGELDLADRINQAGQEGWEAVGMTVDDWNVDVLLKRPIGEDSE